MDCPAIISATCFENIIKDRVMTNAEKRDLIQVLASSGGDLARAADTFTRFGQSLWFDDSKLIDDISSDEGFGHLISTSAFRSLIATACADLAKADRYLETRFPRWYPSRGAPMPDDEMRDVEADFSTAFVRSDLVWIFRHPRHSADPYAGLDLALLPWCLGLDTRSGYLYVKLQFPSRSADKVYVPSIRHVRWEYRDLWHWAGKTRPHGPAEGQEGLDEGILRPLRCGTQPYADILETA